MEIKGDGRIPKEEEVLVVRGRRSETLGGG